MPTKTNKKKPRAYTTQKRWMAKNLVQGLCRMCGKEPRLTKADGSLGSNCRDCQDKSNAYTKIRNRLLKENPKLTKKQLKARVEEIRLMEIMERGLYD